ncbi:MAG: hypothetical protein DHS20C20_02490 [Ardenticatenaceae bacterium]|nr:MAG: hypothetical protein DHS20C20_02490 [Ardenticatenaceae bacterium]
MSPNEEQVQGEMNATNELPPLPEADLEAIAQGVNLLFAQLSGEEGLAGEVEAVIREHLRTAVTTDTFLKIYGGLELYLEEDAVVFLLENLRRGDDATYIAHVKIQCAEPLWHWLRRQVALYGADFRKAYTIGTEKPDAWETLNRRTYYDSLNGTWVTFLEVVKYNGERLTIEETPRGALTLAYGVIDMLKNIPADFAPDLIERDYLAQVHLEFLQLMEHYAPGLIAEIAKKNGE